MDRDVKNDVVAAWRCLAAFLIYPVTIFPGLHALSLTFSSLCIFAESWSLEGAMSNLSLGIPALAGIAALWSSVIVPFPVLARDRRSFVLVAAGLMAGLVLEGLFLMAGLNLGLDLPLHLSVARVWLFVAPPIVAAINLSLLIRASQMAQADAIPVRVESSGAFHPAMPRHHLPGPVRREPVVLRPYRPETSA
ncbi:hypothetical protein [Aquisphaera insulae]|uniref:hypothetical protein n=1 Tax=Aquisphaera insulae TaxID=2712864 RepID=UPI0013E9CE56|nr:hypothetical protein [Aquisphaera insulae]